MPFDAVRQVKATFYIFRAFMAADALTLSLLDPEEQKAAPSTVGEFRAGKALVLDFWTTRCVRCPAGGTQTF